MEENQNHTKKCPKCGVVLPYKGFYKDRTKIGGLGTYCITCTKKRNKKHYRENVEKIKKQRKEYCEKNIDTIRLKAREAQKRAVKDNPDFYKDCYKKYIENKRTYYKNNKEKIIEKNKKRKNKLRFFVFEKLGSFKCIKCGFDNINALCIDHINNDGSEDRKKIGFDSIALYRKILNMPQSEARNLYQVLCRNCNWLKYIEWVTG